MRSLCESREFLKERMPCLNLFFRAASFTNRDRQASSSSLTCTAFSSHFFSSYKTCLCMRTYSLKCYVLTALLDHTKTCDVFYVVFFSSVCF